MIPPLILGPLFLVFTLFLAGHAGTLQNFDLAFIAILGLFFSAKWHFRGCIYALMLLSLSAGIKHAYLFDHHLWQIGFEASTAISFLITALVFDESENERSALVTQSTAQAQTIQYLEEDLSKVKENSAQEISSISEKMGTLQTHLEETSTELASFGMLNEVLRKSTAKALEEQELARGAILREKRGAAEIELLQKQLSRLRNQDTLAQQNAKLFLELNEARFRELQTKLINETLVRLRASENQKVKELEKELAEMEAFVKKADLELAEQKLAKISPEREVELLAEIEQLKNRPKENYEHLYAQLKKNFDEKNELIHKTRAELFRTDTELQTLHLTLANKNLEVDPLVEQANTEVDKLLTEQTHLYEQIDQLQDLVAHLIAKPQKKN